MSSSQIPSIDTNFLIEYGKHEDLVFYQRINFFLVAESMLLLGYTTLLSCAHPEAAVVMHVLEALGILITISWLYINFRQLIVIEQIRQMVLPKHETYRTLRTTRKRMPSSTRLLAYLVPTGLLFAWIALVIFV